MAKVPTKGSYKVKSLLIDKKPTAYNTRFKENALSQVMNHINEKGLPLLLVHNSQKLPIGAWYEASIEDKDGPALISKFFVPKEIPEYSDVKTRIDAKILDSVSLGFRADIHDCSICGNDIQDYENCPHIPGRTYNDKVCYVELDDIRPVEGSLVYAGAVPAAKVIDSSSKQEFFDQNHINFGEDQLEVIQTSFNVQNKTEQTNERKQMEEKYAELLAKYENAVDKKEELFNKLKDNDDVLQAYQSAVKEAAKPFDADYQPADTTEDLAKDLKKFTDKAIEAYQTVVKEFAAALDPEYKPAETIVDLTADLKKFVDQAKALPTGQQSTDESEATYEEPDSAYKV